MKRSFQLMALVCACAPSMAAGQTLRLAQALEQTRAAHPLLRAEALGLQAERARAELDSLPTPYRLGLQLENAAGTGTLSGVQAAEATLQVSRVYEGQARRTARRAQAEHAVAVKAFQGALSLSQLERQTKLHFIAVAAAQRRLALSRQRLDGAKAMREEIKRWVDAARNPESDLVLAELSLSEQELALEHATHAFVSARRQLSALWSSRAKPSAFESVEYDWDLEVEPPAFEVLKRQAGSAWQAQYHQLRRQQSEARIAVLKHARRPDFEFSAGLRRLEANNDQALVLAVSMPLGQASRASLAERAAVLDLADQELRAEAEQLALEQRLFDHYQELRHARLESLKLRTQMMPMAEQAEAFAKRAFERGRFSFKQLHEAQSMLLSLQDRLLEAETQAHSLTVELDAMCQSLESHHE
jgi:cobalt-zinc-cadmium efflux system outer membrane protein